MTQVLTRAMCNLNTTALYSQQEREKLTLVMLETVEDCVVFLRLSVHGDKGTKKKKKLEVRKAVKYISM